MRTTMPRPFSSRTGLIAVSAGALLWGTTGVAVSIVHERSGLSAVPIGWYRVLIAALVIAGYLRLDGLRRARAAFARHRLVIGVCGVGFAAYQALYFVGVQYVGVSVSTLVSLGVAPVALTVGTAVAGRRRPANSGLVVLGCALIGLALISLRPGGDHASHPVLGVLASVGSGLGYAASTVLSRRVSDEEPLVLTGLTSAIATLVLLPLALPFGLAPPADVISSGWLIYIGIVPTIAAYALFYRGLRSTTPEVAGVLTLLEPLTAALLAAAVLHESLSGWAVLGGVLMLVAVASLYLRRPIEPELPPP
ncbi:MAG: DMT family transporter [Jatrophihabitans sp.]